MEYLDTLKMILSWVGPFLIVLTILVFIHELGHYLVARRAGVKIDVFSIGFGPELFGFNDRHGTRWKFSLIPLGGYVKMFGDANAASVPDFEHQKSLSKAERALTLESKTVGQRIAVCGAGPVANIGLTFVLLMIVYGFVGKPSDFPVIGDIAPQSAAAEAGLQVGDRLLSINDTTLTTYKQVQQVINRSANIPVNLMYERDGTRMALRVIPKELRVTPTATVGILGIKPLVEKPSLWRVPFVAAKSVLMMSKDIMVFLGSLVIRKADSSQLGSIMSIAKMSKDSFENGLFSVLGFMALLSLNLGIINLFPIPGLDGGHLFFYLIEAIRGKPLSQKVQDISFKIGFGILMAIMVFTMWNDVIRFNIVKMIMGIFK